MRQPGTFPLESVRTSRRTFRIRRFVSSLLSVAKSLLQLLFHSSSLRKFHFGFGQLVSYIQCSPSISFGCCLSSSLTTMSPKWFEAVLTKGAVESQTYSGVSRTESGHLYSGGRDCGVFPSVAL